LRRRRGDDCAFKAKLGVKGDFARIVYAVALDVQVRGGIAAHGRKGAIHDAVAAHDHVCGTKNIDAIAILAGAAGAVADIFDPVVDDDRAVIAVDGAPDLDAVVARAIDPVARNQETRSVEDVNCSIGNVGERRAAHLTAGRDADEPAASGILDLAVGDADGGSARPPPSNARPARVT
jgi:hypothetical protein